LSISVAGVECVEVSSWEGKLVLGHDATLIECIELGCLGKGIEFRITWLGNIQFFLGNSLAMNMLLPSVVD